MPTSHSAAASPQTDASELRLPEVQHAATIHPLFRAIALASTQKDMLTDMTARGGSITCASALALCMLDGAVGG